MKAAILLLLGTLLLTISSRHNDGVLANMIQDGPLRVSRQITVVGTSYVSANKYSDAIITIPESTMPGDMLVIYIGGSHAGKRIPSSPIPRTGWEEVIEIGPSDLNLKAFYKPYESYDDIDTYKVTDGKSTFVSIVTLRGVNMRRPVIDSGADKDVMSGRDGAARAPSVLTEDEGLVIASYVYDDPQVAQIMRRHDFEMILSTDTRSGDGMAIGVKSTREGETGYIYAEGTPQPGGGNEIGMAISFRADDNGQYNLEQNSVVPDTPRPTRNPTEKPSRTPTHKHTRSETFKPTTRPTRSPTEAAIAVNAEPIVVVTDAPSKRPTKSPPTTQKLTTSGSSSSVDDETYDGGEEDAAIDIDEESNIVDISEDNTIFTTLPENTSSTQQEQTNDTAPLLIGVMVGLTVFSIVVLAAAIKYRRDTLRDSSFMSSGEAKVVKTSGSPIRSDTFVSEASDGDEPTHSWTAWVSEVESELSVIEEGRIVCANLPRLSGFAQFVPRSESPPPPPPPLPADGF